MSAADPPSDYRLSGQVPQASPKVAGAPAACQPATMHRIIPARPNFYTGSSLNRAGHLRDDQAWMADAWDNPASQFVVFRQGRPGVSGLAQGTPRAHFMTRPAGNYPWVFLGLLDEAPVFAADLSLAETSEIDFTDLRSITSILPADDAAILATGRAMLYWRAQNSFCAVCGARNHPVRGGYVLRCESCGAEHFPRSDPAVIMLVVKDHQVLLGQSHKFPVERNFYSALAGFVEPGESLEDAVRREVFEEVGIRVDEVAYHSSQPWPFPASLMIGFYAQALDETIVLEAAEMRDAKWFTAEDIQNRKAAGFNLPPQDSIARRLIEDWMAHQPPGNREL